MDKKNMDKMDIDAKLFEDTINEIMPGLAMYVRDTDLEEKFVSKYKVGMIIKERGFTDASSRVGGMDTSFRYAILSNHMSDLSQYENGTNWGLHIAKSGAHFKVIDIYEYEGKKQVLLLHLPDDLRWTLFKDAVLSIDEDIVADSRKRFENKCKEAPIKELMTKEWKHRCEFPLGISDAGDVFELDETIESLLKPIRGESFRKLEDRLLYIECPKLLDSYKDVMDTRDMTGVVAYGYIDESNGMSFCVYGSARVDKDVKLVVEKLCKINDEQDKNDKDTLDFGEKTDKDNGVLLILRRESIGQCRYVDLCEVGIGVPDCSELIKMIHDNYEPKSADKIGLRQMDFLDGSRHEDYPDDVAVILPPSEGMRPERVWVRANRVTDKMLYGEMLNEPKQDFGVHKGDEVGFVPLSNDEEIILVASFE